MTTAELQEVYQLLANLTRVVEQLDNKVCVCMCVYGLGATLQRTGSIPCEGGCKRKKQSDTVRCAPVVSALMQSRSLAGRIAPDELRVHMSGWQGHTRLDQCHGENEILPRLLTVSPSAPSHAVPAPYRSLCRSLPHLTHLLGSASLIPTCWAGHPLTAVRCTTHVQPLHLPLARGQLPVDEHA